MTHINKKTISYIGLIFVVLVWGCCPLLTLKLYSYYSPTIRICFSELVLIIAYILMSGRHINEFNSEYIKIGVTTGVFLSFANITQKIGLLYTTPAKYAFLENLSCITVPVLMYIVVKKKPRITTVAASFLCLMSTFILNGISFSDSSWKIGEILCAISGLLYGFNIAGTSIYAKKLNVTLYLATQSVTSFFISLITAVILNLTFVQSDSGLQKPIEQIVFSINPVHIAALVLLAIVSSALCWSIRTYAMKHIDASIVAIIMPFSAVITSVLSVMVGTDTFNINLLLGGLLGLFSIFLSSFEDIFKKHPDEVTVSASEQLNKGVQRKDRYYGLNQ